MQRLKMGLCIICDMLMRDSNCYRGHSLSICYNIPNWQSLFLHLRHKIPFYELFGHRPSPAYWNSQNQLLSMRGILIVILPSFELWRGNSIHIKILTSNKILLSHVKPNEKIPRGYILCSTWNISWSIQYFTCIFLEYAIW